MQSRPCFWGCFESRGETTTMRTRHHLAIAGALCSLWLCLTGTRASATPWIWDHDENRIDDRIERVKAFGLTAAHQGETMAGRLVILVHAEDTPLTYDIYTGYDHKPTDDDVDALTA